MLKVKDDGNDNYGFIDRTDQAVEFTYDANGNLLTDTNKGITGTQWNHLNMPTNITVNNPQHNGTISYVYSAAGIKVQKTVNDNGNITVTDYAGPYQYVNGTLEFIRNIEDGYVYPKNDGSYGYMYYYTDQLDNIRLMYSDADGNGTIDPATEIVKEEHFYPFGMKLEGFNGFVEAVGSDFHKYDYQNQERQGELGLDWLQFKYRMHDPATGRFVSVDPLADSYVHNATYAFAENKVIMFNELEGLEITLNKFQRMSYENKSWLGKATTFVGNAGISVANGAIDLFNYAGDLDRADQASGGFGQGAGAKVASDASAVAGAVSDYAQNTSLEEFGADLK
ncbi:RHS repeat-associated core domain-containing protein, partial [Ascidiimonas aurantiaca]|uniref:RHS repeat domain-containing protein n=1 Tax=Ascidiimonas aurantiaca TaxID=1685432 RepID=UPI0030ED18A6